MMHLRFPDGEYVGQAVAFQFGYVPHGQGTKYFINGDVYNGGFLNGYFHGIGTYNYSNGDSYRGNYYQGIKQGQGVKTFANGDVYNGGFVDGHFHGFGTYNSNGDSYRGNFYQGVKHGQGVKNFANGDVYNGDFFNDKFHGQGMYRRPNGESYKGNYRENIRFGQGVQHFANGEEYDGCFVNNKFQGYGEYKYPNGDVYKGQYDQGRRHGPGEFYRARDKRRYIGEFVRGTEEGYATITKEDFEIHGGHKRYEGYVKGGKRHGPGTQFVTGYDGKVTELRGNWVDDLLNGLGSMKRSAYTYTGTFVNGNLEGEGSCLDHQTKETKRAIFKQGSFVRYVD